jgi:hypothetical protein
VEKLWTSQIGFNKLCVTNTWSKENHDYQSQDTTEYMH